MEYDVGNIDQLELCIQCPRDVRELEEFLECGEHSCDWVARVVNHFINNVLPFKDIKRHQLTVVFLKMHEYARDSVIYGIFVLLWISAR